METPAKLSRLFGVLMIIFLCSCESPCENVFYEVAAVKLIPKKLGQPTSDHALWRNEDQLPIGSLMLKLEMFKPILYGGGTAMSNECLPDFINTKPATSLKLISNKDYNSQYPAGSNLMGNISFSLFDDRKISEKTFLNTQFNVTKWNYYYMGFNNNPSKSDLHTLILSVVLSDGSELKSPATVVLLRP